MPSKPPPPPPPPLRFSCSQDLHTFTRENA